jgi:putative zinc finger protein
MTEVPKIVYDRLRAAGPEPALSAQSKPGPSLLEPAHPNADLLTALAEQALSATERAGVLEHLALCGDCREVVALALPDAGMAAVPTADHSGRVRATAAKSQPNWLSSYRLAWPSLRWAVLAAGIALAASLVLLHPGKLNQATLRSASPQLAHTTPPASSPQIASPTVASSPVPTSPVASSPMTLSSTIRPSVLAQAGPSKTDAARTRLEPRLSKKLKAGPTITQEQSGMLLADNRTSVSRLDKPPAVPSAAIPAFKPPESAPRSVTETVEVTAANGAVETESFGVNGALAQNDAPAIEKAKPALQDEVIAPRKTGAGASAASAQLQGRNAMSVVKLAPSPNQTLAPNVTWLITAGVLQRSLDSGQSWQNALHANHPLLCYASRVSDVWTGGQAGALFHSVDGGVTWLQVQPSSNGDVLTSDVTRIDIREVEGGPAQIIVSTNGNEMWSSADGGKTWQKK